MLKICVLLALYLTYFLKVYLDGHQRNFVHKLFVFDKLKLYFEAWFIVLFLRLIQMVFFTYLLS